ncbi:MAG: hypothetical protein LBP31_01550 [Holosporales bacterium]|jgi:hypothetical protein|nr:hypothetical protein [Holosporales bacterium]
MKIINTIVLLWVVMSASASQSITLNGKEYKYGQDGWTTTVSVLSLYKMLVSNFNLIYNDYIL